MATKYWAIHYTLINAYVVGSGHVLYLLMARVLCLLMDRVIILFAVLE